MNLHTLTDWIKNHHFCTRTRASESIITNSLAPSFASAGAESFAPSFASMATMMSLPLSGEESETS
jgi:hypothetical protein